MHQAINEVHEMAINAVVRIERGDPSTIHLLESLFGKDHARYLTVSGYLSAIALKFPTSDFVVICNDLMVKIEPDPSTDRKPDPRGRWVDTVHGWHIPFDKHEPCDPLRKPGLSAGHAMTSAYTVSRYIYLCPDALDSAKGRILAPYKDQILAGKWIDDYVLTP
ncbi:hypothetical protein MMC22_011768, partial [Lobaria immixta]|nr:hypothetical protein [Lobaria immixta]